MESTRTPTSSHTTLSLPLSFSPSFLATGQKEEESPSYVKLEGRYDLHQFSESLFSLPLLVAWFFFSTLCIPFLYSINPAFYYVTSRKNLLAISQREIDPPLAGHLITKKELKTIILLPVGDLLDLPFYLNTYFPPPPEIGSCFLGHKLITVYSSGWMAISLAWEDSMAKTDSGCPETRPQTGRLLIVEEEKMRRDG